MSTIEVATAEPTAPHRACSQLMIMGLPDATLHRFILGLDGRPQQLVDGDALAQLGDDFATLLLRKGVFPRTAGEVLAGLVSATPDGHPLRIQRFFLVGEGSQIPRQAAPVARNLRFVVACGRGPEGANIILSSFHPDQGVVEVIAWDSAAGGFNFYRTMPDSSAWVFAGNSRHALVGPTRGNGPFESHVNGHFLMKELNVPWVNWHSPFATVSASVLTEQGLEFHPWVTQLEPGGAYTLEDDIARPAIKRWTTARVSAMSAGTALETPRRFAEQLLDTLTVNLISSRTSSAAAMSGAAAPVDLPASFFVDAASLELVGVLPDLPAFRVAADVYTAVMRSVGARLDDGTGFTVDGDTHFAFVVPERAGEDVETFRQAVAAGIFTKRLVACLLMVDFPNPVFSSLRPRLLRFLPDESFSGDGGSFSTAVAERILASPEAKESGTAEGEFAQLWGEGESFESPFADRLRTYFTALEEQLSSQHGFDAYVRLAESRRAFVRKMPIAESPLLFATTAVPPARRTMTVAGMVEEG